MSPIRRPPVPAAFGLSRVDVPRPVVGVRNVLAVALQRAMSNGSISRRPGWLAVLLLPVTLPAQLPLVLLGGDQVQRTRAASLMQGRAAQIRPAAVLASFVLPLVVVVYLSAIDVFTDLSTDWVCVATIVFVVVELAGAVLARCARLAWRFVRRQGLPLPEAALDTGGLGPPVPITFVVAFPRGGGRGSALMRGLELLLDRSGTPVVLTARTARLVGFYANHGFQSLSGDPRQMLRLPRSTESAALGTSPTGVGTNH